ncbi:MAG: magnesium chelatase [Isosphaeraceae bacterium]
MRDIHSGSARRRWRTLLLATITATLGGSIHAEGPPASPPLEVVSKAKASERTSEFLRPPGAGRYDQVEDWREIPPWRRASFYGIQVRGQFFIYVVDRSGSMIDGDRLDRAKDELRRSVFQLREPQRFHVLFYNEVPMGMPGGLPCSADLGSKSRFFSWLNGIQPDGGTDPRAALGQALSLRPDAVFLLSDGAFPDGTVEAVARRNPRKVPIHCIDLSGGRRGDHLQRIAAESGGQFVSRP